ncbi:LCP family protein [Streptomyces sulphureus]|uniref:LCP family protein n=1 Tax=Streptomyces sulphureus TaxID=47758 RepID=UPI00037F9BCD|nr:LCP family protein [Streptomyces sulphureus]
MSGKRARRNHRRVDRSRRNRVFAWSGGVLAVLILLAGAGGAWVYTSLDGNIHSADLSDRLGGDRPDNLSPGSKNILVIGSDSRDGANSKYGKDLETMQSDTLMVVHVSADHEWASVVSLPRDSYVPIPACDRGNGSQSQPHRFKINESYAIGGTTGDVSSAAACTIKTVEKNTGLRIDHFMSVDFQGFKGMVNALGGIEVCPKEPIDDEKAQLKLDAGCQTVKDEDALGYVRVRYSVGNGSDTDRIGRQQEFMRALAEKAQAKLTSPKQLYDFLDSATKSLTTDKELAGIKPLYELASKMKDIPQDRLHFVTVPNYPREADVPKDKANLVWQYPQAPKLFSDLAKDRETDEKKLKKQTSSLIYASRVPVQVLNGTGKPGAAAEAAGHLRALGFPVTTGNAPSNVEETEVSYPPGMGRKSLVLSSRLADVTPQEDSSASPGHVTLVLGPDYERVD